MRCVPLHGKVSNGLYNEDLDTTLLNIFHGFVNGRRRGTREESRK